MKFRFTAMVTLNALALIFGGLTLHTARAKDVITPHAPQTFSTESFVLPGGVVEQSSAVLADLNEDGVADIIVGTTAEDGANGNARTRPMALVAMQGNGRILWSKNLDAPMNSSPAVGDINQDGHVEVVISTGGDVSDRSKPGALLAFDHNGNQIWRYNFVDNSPRDGFSDGAFSSPTLCDVDGNGTLEIALGSWDMRIYLIDASGKALWSNLNRPANFPVDGGYYNADTIWSTAACADLNGDGQQEIMIGADITGGGVLPDGTRTQDGGFLYIFDKTGNVLVRRYLPETIFSSPAVGDLNHDGRLEIVVGTGYYWWDAKGRTAASYVYAFDTSQVFSGLKYADAAKLPDLAGWPQQTTYPGFSSPALADLDGDGSLEVLISTGHPFVKNDTIAGAGQVYAWHANGQLVSGWPVSPKNIQGWDAQITSSPTVADVDGDGQLDVLFSMIWDVNVYGANGAFKEWLSAKWTTVGSPAVGDTNGDGKVDVWVGSANAEANPAGNSGYLWHFKNSAANIGALPWPMFHQNAKHTGLYPTAPKPTLPTTQIFVLRNIKDTNAAAQLTTVFALANSGGAAYNWRVINKPAQVTLQPDQGTVNPGGNQSVQAIVDTSELGNGTHTLGNLQIEVTSNGAPVSGNPLTVAITAYVGPVNYNYLPVIRR